MAGRTATQRAALDKQNAAVMKVFARAGFQQIAPDIIQPADIFLERSGEDIRARTFVFSDPEGRELALRPDLTVPACRFHLSHAKPATKEARYAYLGPAFRFPDEKLSPQEFTQAGLEWFGAKDAVAVEAQMLKLALAALAAAGVKKPVITIGDLGLFAALLADTEMPDRWRRRLAHQFWRPEAFRNLLHSFASREGSARTSISGVIDAIADRPALEAAEQWLATHNLPQQAARSLEEIADRLAEKKADRSEAPLPRSAVAAIESYLALSGAAPHIEARLSKISAGPHFATARANFARRLAALQKLKISPANLRFSASFGREIEYYTGFVFQLSVKRLNVAGGGRYDDMLKDLGAKSRIPAFGFAIHTERLLAART